MNKSQCCKLPTILAFLTIGSFAFGADLPVQRKPSDGPLFAYQLNGKWGFIDATGDVVFEPQFSNELSEPRFSNGHAVVMFNGRQMYLTQSGATILPPDGVAVLGGYADGLFRVNVGQRIRLEDILADAGLWGFMDAGGKFVIKPEFAEVGVFSEGVATAGQIPRGERRPKWGYLDRKGAWVIEPKFLQARAFSEGLAFVGVAVPGERFVKQGVIDATGTMVIKPEYDQANSFQGGVAAVMRNEKWAYIDKMGNAICDFEFDAAEPMSNDRGLVWKWDKNKQGRIVNSRCGFLSKDGRPVTKIEFESGYSFSDGMAAVQTGGKFGFIDQTGTMAVEARYPSVGAFSEGLVAVQVDGKYGYINKSGEMVIEPRYDFGQPFSGGLARVFLNREKHEHGYVNKQGKLVFQFQLQPRVPAF